MLEEKLEIFIITYNRAKDIENTLEALLKSPFAKTKITIFDNCSTDNTPLICNKYEESFPNLSNVRHRRNIGGLPNYLRAIEFSKSVYTWVLCDDDTYDFTDCSDIIDAIENESVDMIFLYDWKDRQISSNSEELIKKYNEYFKLFSFMPGIIFKTDLFDSDCIAKSYFIISDLYPQFMFINKSIEENFSVYISKKQIIHRGFHNDMGRWTPLYYFTSWVNSCEIIKDKALRRKTMYECPGSERYPFLVYLFINIFMEKVMAKHGMTLGKQGLYRKLSMLYFSFSFDQKILLLLVLPFAFIPSCFYKLARYLYRYLKYGKWDNPEDVIFKKKIDLPP